ncbi:MAG: threonine-phosphate decarboxylase CobD [Thermodesulfovibrionales bacterium]|nr:threonine-phosphate decarboxylase CobD [Thermodesulfovibrionales bacterium]
MINHGGNIHKFAREFKISKNRIIDFSASINPLGLSPLVVRKLKEIDNSMCYYPDPETKELREVLSNYLRIDEDTIICGNGSTELIYLCVKALRPSIALIPAPTFSEYERACRLFGVKIRYCLLKREDNFDLIPKRFIKKMENSTIAFLCNPNNPTGRLVNRDDILEIADRARRLKCYLVVDEAFIDFLPEHSVIGEVKRNPYLIVLRSMTKFYALASIRLGYGVFHSNIIKTILRYKEPWTVNAIAQKAGVIALEDTQYREKTLEIIKKGKSLMEKGLKRIPVEFVPSMVNYYLLRMPKARKVISELQRSLILLRDCSNFRGLDDSYARVAVRTPKEIKRLLEELTNLCER